MDRNYMITYIFYFLSFLAVFFALLVVTAKNPVHSVLYLILAFFAIAGHYILLNAQFLAVVHIIVYAGAIMVLFLHVIMLLNLNADTEPQHNNSAKLAAAVGAGLLLVILIASLKKSGITGYGGLNDIYTNQIGSVKNLGKVLFKDFLLPFEVSSLLFLAGIIGTVVLGKKEVGE
jgi:NADH-quinone oxidoreductase subunit J